MKTLMLQETNKTPFVKCDPIIGVIELKGRSIPENATSFFSPIVDEWLENYLQNPVEPTTFNVALEYFNTSTSMWILRILKKLDSLFLNKNKKVVVNWHYTDEDILDSGVDFQKVVSVPFIWIDIQKQ